MVRWGIAGTGGIAHTMARTLAAMDDAEIVAVSSNAVDRGVEFAEAHGIGQVVTPHAAVADAEVDAVYVANTNDKHLPVALSCLDAGVAVLCEKPLALDEAEARQMVDRARQRDVFLMEAMWMVFQPSVGKMHELIDGGAIGRPRHVVADFGFPADRSRAARLFDPALGGGSLLDLGIYPLTLAIEVLGSPVRVAAAGTPTNTGVDDQMGATVIHENDGVSSISSSIVADTSVRAVVSGAEGRLELASRFHNSPAVRLLRGDDVVEEWDTSYDGSGYRFEVEEVHRCLAQGLTESPRRPLDKTLEVMHWIDRIAAQLDFG